MNKAWRALRSLVYATVFLGLWAWLAWESRALDKYFPGQFPAAVRPLGVILIIAGAALAASTVAMFVTFGQGTPAPFDPPKRLVPRGPYRFVRNPMYIGGISALFGFGLDARSPTITLMGFVVFLLFHAFVLWYEEPGLRKRFGQDYEAYCRAVPRWIPRLTAPGPQP